jgi:transcriptional antiterminator NusG
MFEIGRDPFADPADARHENLVDDAQMADLAGAVDTAVSDDAPVEGVTQDVIVEDEAVQDVTTEDSAAEGSTGEVATAAEAAVRSPRAKDDRNWFVVHTYSGYENKVKANLERRIHSMNMQDKIFRVLVPMEDEVEFKDGKRKITPKKVFPGYVLVEMTMDDQSWYVVRNTQGVTGFVGSPGPGEKPVPLPDKEVKTILKQMGIEAPKLKIDFKKGDRVKVTSGPFFDFTGVVDEITPEKERLRALISIFGRETPVELEFFQVEKV